MKARTQPHRDKSSNMRNVGMNIIDREREKEWLAQMDTILIFVCLTSLWRCAELIGCPGAIVRGFHKRFPDRTPRSSRTRPHGYHTGCSDLSNANDA